MVAKSSAPVIRPGGFTVFRTDTLRYPTSSGRIARPVRKEEDMIFRTSAGRTSTSVLNGDTTGRYVVVVTGSGFPPQVVFCCTSEPRDLPLEADGRVDAPQAIAATLDGPLARYVLRDRFGAHTLVSYTVSEAEGQPFNAKVARPFQADARSRIAMAPGIVAVATDDTIRLGATSAGSFDVVLNGPVLQADGTVTRLHATRTMIAALVRTDAGQQLVRYDAPSWTPTVIWRGTSQPPLSAAGDRTVVFTNARGVVTQSVPGRTRELLRLKGKLVALATDGRQVAIAERRTVTIRKRAARKTAIVVATVLQPPGAYTPGGGS